ncbi:MAG: CDP-glycerol glycerophosphotransferase family protein [Anaerocolumna sp.]
MIAFRIKQYIKMVFQNIVLPTIYYVYSRGKIDENLVVFADAHHENLPYSMETIYVEMKAKGYTVIDCFSDYKKSSMFDIFGSMLSFMRVYAKAKYVFICDNFLPVASCNKRKETEVIQLWHAGGILKKYAYDTERDIPKYYKSNVFKNYTLVTVSAEICRPVYVSAMRTGEKYIKATGLSRTDRFFQREYFKNCVEEFYAQYPKALGKKIVLWAPTFRGNAGNPKLVGYEEVAKLQEQLGEDWFVLMKVHPHIDTIKKVSNCDIQTERLLPVIDVLISDYSSVIFDYILLDKPLVLYVPDLKEFQSKNELYIEFDELPGRVVEKKQELLRAVFEESESFDLKKIQCFKDKFMGACDGNATYKILKLLNVK